MTGIDFIVKAHEEELDEKIFRIWLSLLPGMDEKTFMSFNDFKKDMLEGADKEKQTEEDMLHTVQRLNTALGGEVVM